MRLAGLNGLVRTGQDGSYSSPSHESNAQRWGIPTPAEESKDGAKRRRRLRNDGDARDRMYFYPFGVKRILHQSSLTQRLLRWANLWPASGAAGSGLAFLHKESRSRYSRVLASTEGRERIKRRSFVCIR